VRLISTAIGTLVPGSVVLGPDGHPWEVWPGGWISSASGNWHLVKDPTTRVLWCIYEESDAIAALAAHFTIESMEIITDGH
jgi:hypothetical protein